MIILGFCLLSLAAAFTSALKRGECSPLTPSPKLKLLCTQRNLTPISCDEAIPNGGKVYFQCLDPPYRESYKPTYSFITCSNGNWNAELQDDFCELVCGERVTQEMEAKSGGFVFYNGEFPWHVAVYAKISGRWIYGCGGTIISHRAVVTSVNCLVNYPSRKGFMSANMLRIAAGKYHMELNVTDKYEQIREVEYVYVPKTAKDSTSSDELAFILLKKPIEYNAFVRPVCLDFESDFESEQLYDGSIGIVTGWDVSSRDKKNDGRSDTLQVSEVRYVPSSACLEQPSLTAFVTSNTFCAGRLSEEMKICKGDGGGGMYFYRPKDQHYYLRGVIIGGAGCRGFTLLTRISAFSDFVKYFSEMEEIDVGELNRHQFVTSKPTPDNIIQFSGESLQNAYLGRV